MYKTLCLITLIVFTASCSINADKDLVHWIKNKSIVINNDSTGMSINNYKNFDSIFSTKKIVGIGEATHGTSEFNQIRKLLSSHLIENHDFNTIIIEADYGFCKMLNNYISKNDEINIKDSLKRNHHWFYSSSEFLETLMMLKKTNASRENKIQIFGMDIQSIKTEAAIIKSFLQKVDSNNSKLVNYGSFIIENTNIKSISSNTLNNIDRIIDTNKELFISRSSYSAWNEALHCIKLIRNANEFYTDREGDRFDFEKIRDKFMFENIEWIMNNNNNCKVIILAHNGHISKYKNCGLLNILCTEYTGKFLEKKYGDEYYSMGTVFNKGSFCAQSPIDNTLKIFSVLPKISSLPYVFSKTNINSFIIDISNKELYTESVAYYLRNEQSYWKIGTTYNKENWYFVPEREFDAIIFFDSTNAIDFQYKKIPVSNN